jgi:hypothetical protein
MRLRRKRNLRRCAALSLALTAGELASVVVLVPKINENFRKYFRILSNLKIP